MTENSAGIIFDLLLSYTIVICKTFLKNIQEPMNTRRIYELSGQSSNTLFGLVYWYLVSLLLMELIIFLFAFTEAGDVQCGGRKTSPRTSTIVHFIFYFGPLRSASII